MCPQLRLAPQEGEARGIFQQLILAVDYCHRMGVANRDIKLENVLLGGDKKSPVIKLTDFGFCKSDMDSIPTTICGTLGYMGKPQGPPPCPLKWPGQPLQTAWKRS